MRERKREKKSFRERERLRIKEKNVKKVPFICPKGGGRWWGYER